MNYTYEKPKAEPTEKIEEKIYRVKIENIEPAVSRYGNDMWKMIFKISGFKTKIYYYLVFQTNENKKYTDKTLASIYSSFKGIPEGNLEIETWLGKEGIAKIKLEEYDGNVSPKIHYFVTEKAAARRNNGVVLDPFVEVSETDDSTSASDLDASDTIDESKLPF